MILRRLRSLETGLAFFIYRFSGSMFFVYAHVIMFAAWIAFGGSFRDPFPYALLTMVVSLEAIFLTSLVLIAQRRLESTLEEQAKEEEVEEQELDADIEEIQEDLDTLRSGMETLQKAVTRMDRRLRATPTVEAAQ